MTLTEPQLRSTEPSSNGHRRRTAIDARPPTRRVRVPELIVGALVVVVFAIGAVLWHLSAVEKVPALVLTTKVERGATISPEAVRVGYVSSDTALDRLGVEQLQSVVGRVALVDLAPGTLLTNGVVADTAAVGDGQAVAGLALDPGAYPARGLTPGDRVNVIRSADAADLEVEPAAVARGATVIAVEELPSDRLLVTLLAAEGDAERVAAAAGAGGLRLVVVAP